MQFNSYMFILLFLPVSVAGYFLSNRLGERAGKIFLLLASMLFAAYGGVCHLVFLLISALVNSLFVKLVRRGNDNARTIWLILALIFNVAFLAVFKYAGFFGAGRSLIMPLGISFYTFMAISFVYDNYYEYNSKKYSILDSLLYFCYFPKLLQGPIPYHYELIPQFSESSRKKASYENISRGIYLFALGLSKKVLIADKLSIIADYGFGSISTLNAFEAMIAILSYTLQLYFDFSGYCDMAAGVSTMLNIELPVNFNSPYKSRNISDFWKRWHITLTRWLTGYIYIPLGGNRKGKFRTYVNILIVFLVSGLWHGAGWTFLVWGAMHGLLSVGYRLTKKSYNRIPKWLQWLINFSLINVTWTFFRAASIQDALDLLSRVFVGNHSFAISAELSKQLTQPTMVSVLNQVLPLKIVVVLILLALVLVCVFGKNTLKAAEEFKPQAKNWILVYVLMMLNILSLSGVSSFLYVNF